MIDIKLNDPECLLTAAFVKTGTASDGRAYELVKIADSGKGKKSITLWTNHPSGIDKGAKFRLKDITRVKYSSRKIPPENKWVDEVSIEADVEIVTSGYSQSPSSMGTWQDVPPADDEMLPF